MIRTLVDAVVWCFDTVVGITRVHTCEEPECNEIAFWVHNDGTYRCTRCARGYEGRTVTPKVERMEREYQKLRTELAWPYRRVGPARCNPGKVPEVR